MMLELTGKDILALTNESKRKAVLADWQNWGIWHKAPRSGLTCTGSTCRTAAFSPPAGTRATTSFPAAVRIMSTVRASISATRAAS